MKEYIVKVDVNGGEYKSYVSIDNVECAETLDLFTILINDKIKIRFDERVSLTRIIK